MTLVIKAVIFDVGGVLVENPLPKMLAHYSSEFAIAQDKFENVFFEEFPAWQEGQISEDEFWQKIATRLNCPKPTSSDLWLAGIKSDYKEHEKVLKLTRDLKEKGIKIALLSDTETPVAKFLRERYSYFDVFVFSCERGLTKPEKEIFELTLRELGVSASEAVFIDDRPQNVQGAEKVGIRSILFENEEKLVNTLTDILQTS